MSKLERQLDRIHNEQRVVIKWARGDEPNVDRVRQMLLAAIDDHKQRIPLDLRKVDGAPNELVELLIEAQRYARERDKVLSISFALEPMRKALNPRRRRKAGKGSEAIDDDGSIDASEVADALLLAETKNASTESYDISKAEKIIREPKKSRFSPTAKRYLFLGCLAFVGTALAVSLEAFILFGQEQPTVNVRKKTFEP